MYRAVTSLLCCIFLSNYFFLSGIFVTEKRRHLKENKPEETHEDTGLQSFSSNGEINTVQFRKTSKESILKSNSDAKIENSKLFYHQPLEKLIDSCFFSKAYQISIQGMLLPSIHLPIIFSFAIVLRSVEFFFITIHRQKNRSIIYCLIAL